MAVEWLKAKHARRKPTQDGYKPNTGAGDGHKKRPNHQKSTAKEKELMWSRQPKKVRLVNGLTGHSKMVLASELK